MSRTKTRRAQQEGVMMPRSLWKGAISFGLVNIGEAFSKGLADHLARLIPDRFTANMSKQKRKGKIYVDYLRNAKGATAIAAYSTRARTGAPVSVPLAWEELSVDRRSDHFTLHNVLERLKGLKQDPWRDYISVKQKLTRKMRASLGMSS